METSHLSFLGPSMLVLNRTARSRCGWVCLLAHSEPGRRRSPAPLQPSPREKAAFQNVPALCLGGVAMQFLLIQWGNSKHTVRPKISVQPGLQVSLNVGEERGKWWAGV